MTDSRNSHVLKVGGKLSQFTITVVNLPRLGTLLGKEDDSAGCSAGLMAWC